MQVAAVRGWLLGAVACGLAVTSAADPLDAAHAVVQSPLPTSPRPSPADAALENPVQKRADALLAAGRAQACVGDPRWLRYPFEPGYRRARHAAETNVQVAMKTAQAGSAKDLLDAVNQLPVRQSRADEARAQQARQLAARYYRAAIELWESLAAAQPERADLQHKLAMAYFRLAQVSGYWKTAEGVYEKALQLQQQALAHAPDNPAWQRDLATIYRGLGALQFGIGGERPARVAKVAELALREQLLEADPGQPRLLHDLALNYDRLGEMFNIIGNTSQARDAFKAGLETHQQLAAIDSDNRQWQRDYATITTEQGLFEAQRGKQSGGLGLPQLEQGLAMRRALLELQPQDTDTQMAVRDSYMLLAQWHGTSEGNAKTLALFRAAQADMARRAAAHPTDPAWLFYQLEFSFYIGSEIQDVIRPRLGTREAPPPELVESVGVAIDEVFADMLNTVRALVALSARPETAALYDVAQGPRACPQEP
jgi:tetratricopeptide (TPR) repeat protein